MPLALKFGGTPYDLLPSMEGIGMLLMPPAALQAAPSPAMTDGRELIVLSLRHAAALLDAHGADTARADHYRRVADEFTHLPSNVRAAAEAGALAANPAIGPATAVVAAELLASGRWGFLERLCGAGDAEALFCSLPGIGPSLAHKIQEVLCIDSLEGLEAAAHDGRLMRMAGFGPRRSARIASLLANWPRHLWPRVPCIAEEPDVAVLLDVDREYRERAGREPLPRIAPPHYEPDVRSWLPVLHTVREPWHCTAMWSNATPEQRRGRSADWVAVYFHRSGVPEGRRTVVTGFSASGDRTRVVRGREAAELTVSA